MLLYAKDEGAKELFKAHELDAGFDIAMPKDYKCRPQYVHMIDTGIHIHLEPDELAFVLPRSSTAFLGLIVLTGTIDAGYTGSLKIQVMNPFNRWKRLKEGQRIAQLVVIKNSRSKQTVKLLDSPDLLPSNQEKSSRGIFGFGSSGK